MAANCMKISTESALFRYWLYDSNVNRFFYLFSKAANFMNASQNICSGFTKLSTDFSTSNFVDNVYNFVYNSIFSLFRHFLMWITFIRPPAFFAFFGNYNFFCLFCILFETTFLSTHENINTTFFHIPKKAPPLSQFFPELQRKKTGNLPLIWSKFPALKYDHV